MSVKIYGNMNQRGAQLLGRTLVWTAALGVTVTIAHPALAGTLETNGVTLTWNDSTALLPTDQCTVLRYTLSDTGDAHVFDVKLTFTGSTGTTYSPVAVPPDPGKPTNGYTRICASAENTYGAGLVSASPLTVAMQVTNYDFKAVSGTTQIPLNPSQPIGAVSSKDQSCAFDSGYWGKDFCSSPMYLRLQNTDVWATGGAVNFELYSKKRKVPIDDIYGATLLQGAMFPKSLNRNTWIRPKSGSLAPGNYLLIGRGGGGGEWSCSVYYEDVCHWDKEWSSIAAYRFTWDGTNVVNVKRVPAKTIPKVRL